MKAIWNDMVVAESSDIVVVEGNHYFPMDSLKQEFIRPSQNRSTCSWKGEASYLSLEVHGELNADAAWYYPDPMPAAAPVKGRVAFWRGVRVVEG
jgi:uncharacterized protein (DUF427 family)